jgi:hypothetical protein
LASKQLILLSFLVPSRDDYFGVERLPKSVCEGIRPFFTRTGSIFLLSTIRRETASFLESATTVKNLVQMVDSVDAFPHFWASCIGVKELLENKSRD